MDEENRRCLDRFYNGDPDGKIHNLLDYAGRIGEEIDDPWYTRDFQRAWDDIYAGCQGLFDTLCSVVTIDFSLCRNRAELYAELRRKMAWETWYGENLDALWDVVTGLPHKGSRFRVIPPEQSADESLCEYAAKIEKLLQRAGVLA
jgi:RNAse (barnase) inhibitor barstar